ncbi:MAG: Ig-like domain-containing protein [Clostridia bacterium]|nr:Ig-like domain-containing protein [Clostridia bacterium]
MIKHMKKNTKIILLSIISVVILVTVICLICSCGKKEPPVYTVTIVDADRNPVAGVIVSAYQGEEKIKNKLTDENGVATFDFTEGTYTFTLTFTKDTTYKYDKNACTMSGKAVTVVVSAYVEPTYELYNGSKAAIVNDGKYYVEFEAGETVYFLYTPTERGRFKISIDTEADAICEYYGSPIIIYDHDISNESDVEVDGDGKPTGTIYSDFRIYYLHSTQYLYGVKAAEAGSGYFTIAKDSDLGDYSPEELPYNEYVRTHKINKDYVYSGGNLVNFDITNVSLKAVLNESDGYYHLNSKNGPVIYMKLTVTNAYTEALEKICETQPFQHYIYDENGEFKDKITYAPMMYDYFEAADDTVGVYPLTNDLAVAIKDMGNVLGWYKPANPGETHLIFGTDPVTANAWLFACCYESN